MNLLNAPLLYEMETMQNLCGDTMRPGGLDLTARALDSCRLPVDARVLDVGCGSGATLRLLKEYGYHGFGVDVSMLNLQGCGMEGRRLVRGSGWYLPYVTGSFDALLCECSLSIMGNPAQVLAEFSRLLCPDGTLILSDLYLKDGVVLDTPEKEHGLLTQKYIVELLDLCGLKVRVWEDHTRAIKETAAGLIMRYGSLDGFWDCLCGFNQDKNLASSCDLRQVMESLRPGYFLLISFQQGRQ